MDSQNFPPEKNTFQLNRKVTVHKGPLDNKAPLTSSLFQLGLWRFPLQNVPVRAQFEFNGVHLHPGRDMHGAVLRHYSSDYVQADAHFEEIAGKSKDPRLSQSQ